MPENVARRLDGSTAKRIVDLPILDVSQCLHKQKNRHQKPKPAKNAVPDMTDCSGQLFHARGVVRQFPCARILRNLVGMRLYVVVAHQFQVLFSISGRATTDCVIRAKVSSTNHGDFYGKSGIA